jgi:hypothetical protein
VYRVFLGDHHPKGNNSDQKWDVFRREILSLTCLGVYTERTFEEVIIDKREINLTCFGGDFQKGNNSGVFWDVNRWEITLTCLEVYTEGR